MNKRSFLASAVVLTFLMLSLTRPVAFAGKDDGNPNPTPNTSANKVDRNDEKQKEILIQEIVGLRINVIKEHEKLENKITSIYAGLSLGSIILDQDDLEAVKRYIVQNQEQIVDIYKRYIQSAASTQLLSGCSMDDLNKIKVELEMLKKEFQELQSNLVQVTIEFV